MDQYKSPSKRKQEAETPTLTGPPYYVVDWPICVEAAPDPTVLNRSWCASLEALPTTRKQFFRGVYIPLSAQRWLVQASLEASRG